MSDGKNESLDQYKEDDIIELARTSGIPIMAIGYSRVEKEYLRTLDRMAELTGGIFSESPTEQDLEQAYRTMYSQLLNMYVVRGTIMDVPGDGSRHTLTVTARQAGAVSVAIPLIFPAGVPARHQVPDSWPVWYFISGGAVLLLLAGGVIALFVTRKKKRAELERRQKEEAARKDEELEKERQKVEEIERKLNEVETRHQDRMKPPSARGTVIEQPRKERTVIMQPGGGRQTLRLEIKTGIFDGKRFDIALGSEATIGKDADNSISIPETTISARHAAIRTVNGAFVVEDLGSTNGTFINGQRIERRPVTHGDTFKFGKCEGEFVIY